MQVQSGVGRTGKWWGHQHLGDVQPDIMTFAKGIASGFPFAGIAAKSHIMENQPPGTLGGTYGAAPLACAAACATIDVIEEEGLLGNATERGLQLVQVGLGLSGRVWALVLDRRMCPFAHHGRSVTRQCRYTKCRPCLMLEDTSSPGA